MYLVYLDQTQLPVAPSAISIKIANENKTITLINEGEVNILKSPGLSKISFDALLPNQKYPFARDPGFRSARREPRVVHQPEFRSAKRGSQNTTGISEAETKAQLPYDAQYYLSILEQLKTSCKPFRFYILRTDDSGRRLMDSNPMTVSLESYQIEEDAEKYGFDVMVKIELLQYRPYGTKVVEFKKKENTTTATVTENRDTSTKTTTTSYTVVSGDSLWEIARKQLGDGTRHTELYALNKDVIEAEAKKHGRASSSNGWWIYPGTVLQLPS